jgi:Cdc6-like AAA superfamily ATPase
VKVDYINRFKTAKQVSDTLKKLEMGEIDIMIGTHALVGKKVKFKDLGFLYKRSALLEGLPGTGKSVIVNRVMQNVVNNNGVCLFIEDPRYISLAYDFAKISFLVNF